MSIASIILFLVIGAIAGWLAGVFMKGSGFGLLGNIFIGVTGAVIGGVIFNYLLLTTSGFIGSIITALIGAVILLFVIAIIKKKKR